MQGIPSPDLKEQLLPVLACLPTAFLSPRPPPALLPLLSPILRQRVHFTTSTLTEDSPRPNPEDPKTTWLRLLTWSHTRAARLAEIVSNLQLEPHPVSGEIELFGDDVDGKGGGIVYRRLDAETLQARCDVHEHGLGFVWTWCTNDTGSIGLEGTTGGDVKDGWRVAEVLPLDTDDTPHKGPWHASVADAEDAFAKQPQQNSDGVGAGAASVSSRNGSVAESDDDAYWASYDRTPGRTPQNGRTPSRATPSGNSAGASRNGLPTARSLAMTPARADAIAAHNPAVTTKEEQDYFDRYVAEVQPAMDPSDPDEQVEEEEPAPPPNRQPPSAVRTPTTFPSDPPYANPSSSAPVGPDLRSPTVTTAAEYAVFLDNYGAQDPSALTHLPVTEPPMSMSSPPGSSSSLPTAASAAAAAAGAGGGPLDFSSSRSSFSFTSATAPAQAAAETHSPQLEMSTAPTANPITNGSPAPSRRSGSASRNGVETVPAQASVKQHLSTELKSLYRLARGVGIDRGEFERVVRTELEVLGMLEL